jgi:hypothetical protein
MDIGAPAVVECEAPREVAWRGRTVRTAVLSYDGRPSYTVSIVEFRDGKVARETRNFGDPFEPWPARAQWVERMP